MLKRKKSVKTQLFFYSEFWLFLFAPSQANDEDTELVLQDGVKYLGTHRIITLRINKESKVMDY